MPSNDDMETMHDRIRALVDSNGPAEVARRVTLAGFRVTTQGAHKWLHGGDLTEAALAALCRAYHSHPAWVRYGINVDMVRATSTVYALDLRYDRADWRALPMERRAQIEFLLSGLIAGTIEPALNEPPLRRRAHATWYDESAERDKDTPAARHRRKLS